jgi:hypothetical protein
VSIPLPQEQTLAGVYKRELEVSPLRTEWQLLRWSFVNHDETIGHFEFRGAGKSVTIRTDVDPRPPSVNSGGARFPDWQDFDMVLSPAN